MPYIVKSSLDIGGKIIPANEVEINKLIKEKEEFLKENKIEEPTKKEELQEIPQEVEETKQEEVKKEIKKNKKKIR